MGNSNDLSFLCKNLFNYNNLIQNNNPNLINNNKFNIDEYIKKQEIIY